MRVAKLASQADLCYNEATHIVVAGGATNTPARIHSWRNVPMTTLPPHADNGNLNAIPTTSSIYKITCTANKRIYIGSAVNLRKRKSEHLSCLQQNKHGNPYMQNAWNKYGEQSFIFEVLEFVLPISRLAREQYWLNKLKPFGRKGFNIARDTVAFSRGIKQTPEHIEKRRQAKLGQVCMPKTREKLRLANLGKKLSSKTCEKMGQSRRGGKQSPEAIENMRQAQGTPEMRENRRQSQLGRKRSPEEIEKSRQARTGIKRSPEIIEKNRQAQIAAWQRRRSNEHESS